MIVRMQMAEAYNAVQDVRNCVVCSEDGTPLVLVSQRNGGGIWIIDASDKSFVESVSALGLEAPPRVTLKEI